MRKKISIFLVFVMILPLFLAVPTTGSASEGIILSPVTDSTYVGMDKLTSGLRDIISTDNKEQIDVIIEMDGSGDYSILSDIENSNGRINTNYNNADLLSATVPANELLKLALNDHINRIYKDDSFQLPSDYGLKGEETIVNLDMTDMISIENFGIEDFTPDMSVNAFLTDAAAVWAETQAGAGSVIAVIDTGVKPHISLGNRVIGGIDMTSDVGTPFEGFDNLNNINHGTFVSSQAAGNALITFAAGSAIANAFMMYDPYVFINLDGSVSVPLLGTAPLASIFGIKVFSAYGSTSTSIILAGIDYAITMGVDVINLSLGGPSNVPGEDVMDVMIDAASAAGIAVTISAGNSGPSPLQIGSPGTAISAITVGAASTPIQERVYGELAYGDGYSYYSHDENSIVYFSSRGPTSDGRMKPDLVATGSKNLGASGTTGLSFGSGTSYSSPVVAGAAALLSNYARLNNLDIDIKEALKEGAVAIPGFTQFEQGTGYINLVNSLNYIDNMDNEHDDDHDIKDHDDDAKDHDDDDESEIDENVEDILVVSEFDDGLITFSDVTVEASQFAYFSFMVDDSTDFVKVSVDGVTFDDYNAYFGGDRGYGYLSTAKHNGLDNNYLDVIFIGEGDNQLFAYSDFKFEEGLLRFTIENDFISFGAMNIESITIEIVDASLEVEHNEIEIENEGIATYAYVDVYEGSVFTLENTIITGQVDVYTFEITDAYGLAFLELSWERSYGYYGTSDLDFYVFDDMGNFVAYGASLDGVETDAILFSGVYTIVIVGYDVYGQDNYEMNIFYINDLFNAPIYSSALMMLGRDDEIEFQLPVGVHGLAILGTLNAVQFYGSTFYLDVWSDFAQV